MEESLNETEHINGKSLSEAPKGTGKGLFFIMLLLMVIVVVILQFCGNLTFKSKSDASLQVSEYYYIGDWKNNKSRSASQIRIQPGSSGIIFTILDKQVDLKARYDRSVNRLQVYLGDADSISVALDLEKDVLVVPGEGEYKRNK